MKLGALCWNQYTDWTSLLNAGIRAGYTEPINLSAQGTPTAIP